MRDLADRDLWTLVGNPDGAAFGVLFEWHARFVYNFCFRRTADWAMAEDLTSVVFLQAWRAALGRVHSPLGVDDVREPRVWLHSSSAGA